MTMPLAQASKRLKIFLVIYGLALLALNAWLVAWTYPGGGYGALAAMVAAPIANVLCVLAGLLLVYFIKDRAVRVPSDYYFILVMSAAACAVIIYILVFTVYGHGGC